MLEKLDYLIACLGEECGEVQQVVGKIIRFGINDYNPATLGMNKDLLKMEIHDIIAVYEMILEHLDEHDEDFDRKKIEEKKSKVKRYMNYSENKGRLQKEYKCDKCKDSGYIDVGYDPDKIGSYRDVCECSNNSFGKLDLPKKICYIRCPNDEPCECRMVEERFKYEI